MIVNISDAKTNLSKLIDMVCHGEKVIIAKHNLFVFDLVIHKPTGKRRLGLLKILVLRKLLWVVHNSSTRRPFATLIASAY